jgi:hypothetical protein
MRLFSYCIPIDDGAAPNPFWNVCTLAICKPVIRRTAEEGDWIAALGSKEVNGVNYSGKLVYAMKITRKMSLRKYHSYCKMMVPEKIPDIKHLEYQRRVGDCIYDFDQHSDGHLLPSVHSEDNRATDLRGMNALLSEHFYYFGKNAIELPDKFKLLVRQGQGHQSIKNQPIKNEFIQWLEDGFEKNTIYGNPQIEVKFDQEANIKSQVVRCRSAKDDEALTYNDDRLPLSHWNYFLALESDLKTISRYVEIHEANLNTFSIGLTQLFLATCSEIDVVLKEICKIVSLQKGQSINHYYQVVAEKVPLLFEKSVLLPLYQIQLWPFQHWLQNQPPKWWTAYNKVKHHRNTNYADANLSNTLNALAALYVLIYELMRIYKGKSDMEFSGKLIFKHLQPAQELFMLEGESMWREIAQGKRNLLGR